MFFGGANSWTETYNLSVLVEGTCHHTKAQPCVCVYKDGNGAGRGETGPKDGVFAPALQDFVLPHSRPTLHDGKNFLAPFLLFRAHEALPYPIKYYFLLICPQLLQLFLIKPISLIKIYLKLKINLSHQIKLIFSKN